MLQSSGHRRRDRTADGEFIESRRAARSEVLMVAIEDAGASGVVARSIDRITRELSCRSEPQCDLAERFFRSERRRGDLAGRDAADSLLPSPVCNSSRPDIPVFSLVELRVA
jgi:hypothetical protein